MPPPNRSRPRWLLPALLLLVAAAGTWFGLDALRPHARWLTIEAPPFAIPGEPLELRIEVHVPMQGALHVDLHGSTQQRTAHGLISEGVVTAEAGSAARFRVLLPVPRDVISPQVNPVLYISPTGRWRDRTHAAYASRIKVSAANTSAETGTLRRIPAFLPIAPTPPERARVPEMSWAWRASLALLWLFATAMCWRGRGNRAIRWLLWGCGATALITLLPFGAQIGEMARQFARERGLYENRTHFQTFVITALVVASAAVLVLVLRGRTTPERVAWCGLVTYAGVSLTGFLSLHELDAVFVREFAQVATLRWTQLAAALVTCAACWRIRFFASPFVSTNR